MAAIACFTPPQMDTVLRGLHKIVCNDPTIVADMKNVYQEKMNAFLKKTVQYWGAVEDEKVNEAIGGFTNFEIPHQGKIILQQQSKKFSKINTESRIVNGCMKCRLCKKMIDKQ